MEAKYNSFTTFVLSPDEEALALHFSDYNICFLQNERAKIAEEKLGIILDPENPQKDIARHIELSAQINILTWLIDAINTARSEALRLAKEAETESTAKSPIGDLPSV